MLTNAPMMPDYAWVASVYGLWGWRHMAGTWAWFFARDYGRSYCTPNGGQKLGGIICGALTSPVAGIVWAVQRADQKEKTSHLFFPDPTRERMTLREWNTKRIEARSEKLKAELKERNARIKQLEQEAGIHD